MNNKLKQIAIISAKNAVNALLTNATLVTFFGNWQRELHTRAGWLEMLHIALACVVAREAMIWAPKLLSWSNSGTNGAIK